jgi:hypothetical protein
MQLFENQLLKKTPGTIEIGLPADFALHHYFFSTTRDFIIFAQNSLNYGHIGFPCLPIGMRSSRPAGRPVCFY